MALVWAERKRTTAVGQGAPSLAQVVRSGPAGWLVGWRTRERRPVEMSPERESLAALGRIARRRP